MRRRLFLGLAMLPACWLPLAESSAASASASASVPMLAEASSADWRRIATRADRARLSRWRDAWVEAAASERAAGPGAPWDRGDAFFDFDRALPDPVPPPGDYRCRLLRLGGQHAARPGDPWFACRIGPSGRLEKVGGAQRPAGQVFAHGPSRAVFLGTMVLGDERVPIAYGRDRARDVAGFLERVGPRRWRLTLPYPSFGATLDVVELVPR